MSWSKLAPIVKSTGTPMVSASLAMDKQGISKVVLNLSATIHEEFGQRMRADVSAGGGEHAGSVLIEFDPDGAFEVKRFAKGGGRISIPPGPGLPEGVAQTAPATLGARTNDSLIVKLPVEAWERDIASRARVQPPMGGSSVQPPAARAPGNGVAVDMVEYLVGKGHKISRLAEGRFAMDGETVAAGVVLKKVNDYRAKADLDPLPHGKVW